MSRCLVTGTAGFIGSHLAESLIADGHEVVGVDAFIDYYPRSIKENNLSGLAQHDRFHFHEMDLRTEAVEALVDGCDVIFHLAAMAGLMRSWSNLDLYASCNILATQRLLEAAKGAGTPQVIHVSTSSVYGSEATGTEDAALEPFSPYGITKLAAEKLCRAYESNFGVPVTILRYFSVYGPRQRPDMAYHILIKALHEGTSFKLFGDGEQTRSNTYVSDCVKATRLAFEKREDALGETFNIGGGQVVSLNEVIRLLEDIVGRQAHIEHEPARPGDQKHTAANVEKARTVLGYEPSMSVADGLEAQVKWLLPLLENGLL